MHTSLRCQLAFSLVVIRIQFGLCFVYLVELTVEGLFVGFGLGLVAVLDEIVLLVYFVVF